MIITDTDHNRWSYIYDRSQPATLYIVCTICISPRITLIMHGPVLRPIPATINNFRNNTDLWRRRYIRFNTILWNTLEYTIITRSYTKTYTGHD